MTAMPYVCFPSLPLFLTHTRVPAVVLIRTVVRGQAAAAEGHVQQLEVSLSQARAAGTRASTAPGAAAAPPAGGGPGPRGGPSPTPAQQRDMDRLEREIAEGRRREEELVDARDRLQARIGDLQKQLQQVDARAGGGPGASSSSSSAPSSSAEVQRLREENERLRQVRLAVHGPPTEADE